MKSLNLIKKNLLLIKLIKIKLFECLNKNHLGNIIDVIVISKCRINVINKLENELIKQII